ncbi:hypothetical protein [Streptomyces sp. RPT161]|uniref:hypothetical protein n=1 Tax=Streptomyces sp. RPT161 TaxID=3015993 RepID=UPI0022B923FD|nr:hypothetical protein [Streptomyces sp. RPT161]
MGTTRSPIAVKTAALSCCARVVQGHQQVASLLGGPFGGDVAGDVGDVHPPGAVLDGEQDEQASQKYGVHVEDVNGEDPLGLGGEELRSGAVRALGRRVNPGLLQDLPDRGGGDLPAQDAQFAVNPAILPGVVLAGQAQQ